MAMLDVCAWCEQPLMGNGIKGTPISHGICHGCLSKMRDEMGSIPKSTEGIEGGEGPEIPGPVTE